MAKTEINALSSVMLELAGARAELGKRKFLLRGHKYKLELNLDLNQDLNMDSNPDSKPDLNLDLMW